MTLGPVTERAKRIKRIREVKDTWAMPFVWRNHVTASHEFQLLDVLRDIRLVLTLILLVLSVSVCQRKPDLVVQVADTDLAGVGK